MFLLILHASIHALRYVTLDLEDKKGNIVLVMYHIIHYHSPILCVTQFLQQQSTHVVVVNLFMSEVGNLSIGCAT